MLQDQYGLEMSTDVKTRNIKFLFWGKSATRKTETVLRFFPHVLVIDTEGNSDQCVDMPEIPPFKRLVTKDQRKVLQMLELVAQNKIVFPDGALVDTVSIDSASVLWSVQQEVAGSAAEARAARYNRDPLSVSVTQRDWSLAKRPLKQLSNVLAGAPIKFIVIIAREKDLYKETTGDNDKLVKIGVQPDVMKGTEYEVNVALHMQFDENGKWFAEVTKVQGALAKIFPMGKRLTTFPAKAVMEYSAHLTGEAYEDKSETDVARAIAEQEIEREASHTQRELLEYARTKGIEAKNLGAMLKAAGISGFDARRWKDMKAVVDQAEAQIA